MAIAHDANSASGIDSGVMSQTLSHTTSGSQRLLLVGVWSDNGGDHLTGITYNGVAMTLLSKQVCTVNQWIYLYYLLNPASGTHNIVTSFNTSSTVASSGVSFTGVSQSGFPDAHNEDTGTSNPFTQSLTTIADNCMAVLWQRNTGGSHTAGTNTTAAGDPGVAGMWYTSALKTPPGTDSMQVSYGSGTYFGLMVSFAPFTSAPPSVDTNAATDITDVSATLNGEITDIGTATPDEEGFVWGTSSHGDPGDVAPASAGYDDYETDSGSFSAIPFDFALTGLVASTTYYVRAYAHNSVGYSYGTEISFTTSDVPPFRFTNLPGIVYDPDDTTTIYAERLNDMLERIEALEG